MTTVEGLFVALIVAVVINAGAYLLHEYRQRGRDQRQREMEADVTAILAVLKVWAVEWGGDPATVKPLLLKALGRES